MKRNPVIGEHLGEWILEKNCPADTAHGTDFAEVIAPDVQRRVGLDDRLAEAASFLELAAAAGLQSLEIVFVQAHTIVFKPVTALQLRVFRRASLSLLGQLDHLLVEDVGVLYITGIKSEVNF